MGRERMVYIVDDDDLVRRSLSRLMRANGFKSRCFASTQQLLDEITAVPYGCVVLDISLNEMAGKKLHLRLQEKKIDMPIIAISACGDSAARESAHKIGAQFFLSKPVDDHALLDTIAWVTEMANEWGNTEGDAGC